MGKYISPAIVSAFSVGSLRNWYYCKDVEFPHLTQESGLASVFTNFDEIVCVGEHMSNFGNVRVLMAECKSNNNK